MVIQYAYGSNFEIVFLCEDYDICSILKKTTITLFAHVKHFVSAPADHGKQI